MEFLNGLSYAERVAREEGIDEGTPVGTKYFDELWGEDSPESTMAQAVAAVLIPNDERTPRTQEVLASREHELPGWAEALTRASIGEVIESTQYAGDIVSYALELAIPGSEPVAVNVSIDLTETNGAIYDCFAPELPLDAVRNVMRRNEDQERTVTAPVAGLRAHHALLPHHRPSRHRCLRACPCPRSHPAQNPRRRRRTLDTAHRLAHLRRHEAPS